VRNPIENIRTAWSSPRWRRALVIAAISDVLGFGVVFWPPAVLMLDALTVIALLMVMGFRWPLLFALAVEAVPGLQIFPAWTLVIAALAAAETPNDPPGETPRQ